MIKNIFAIIGFCYVTDRAIRYSTKGSKGLRDLF